VLVLEIFKAIRTRRSIRKYRPDSVPDDLIEKVIDAARWAPSSHDRQPWEFIIVKNRYTIEKLAKTHEYSSFMVDTPLVIAVCVDQHKSPSLFIQDGSAAIQNLLLAAHAIGLGTCWIAIHNLNFPKSETYVQKLLSIPENIRVIALISIGWPMEKPLPSKRRELSQMVHQEKF